MKNTIRGIACALTVLAVSTTTAVSAAEAPPAELTVTGTIKPSSCIPSVSANGLVDYGVLNAADLSPTAYNDLGVKKVSFSITCDGPTKVGIQALNNRAGSVVSEGAEGPEGFAVAPIALFGGVPGMQASGLGLTEDGAKIGGYAARIAPATSQGDTVAVDTIISTDVGKTWALTANPNFTTGQQLLSWAQAGTTLPVSVTTLAADLEVNAYLNKAEALDLKKVVTLDGSTTIEVKYL